MQFETISGLFLRPIEHLILDPDISEIMVNADHGFCLRSMVSLHWFPASRFRTGSLRGVKNIARRLGDDISEAKPILDSRLPAAVRVQQSFHLQHRWNHAHNSQIPTQTFHYGRSDKKWHA